MNKNLIEYRAVCHFLWKKNYKNKDIYSTISDVYDEDVPAFRTIQKWTKNMNSDNWSIFDQPKKGRPKRTELKQEIENVLLYNPYATTQKIAKIVKADRKTVKKVLIDELKMSKVNFKWIPHILTQEIKVKRIEIAKELFEFLTNANVQKLHKVLTQDETWIYLICPRNSMWLESGRPIPEKPKPMIGSKKVMISIIWGITGIKSITMLPKGEKFNKKFFAQRVLGDLAKNIATNGYFLHMDNARPHLAFQKLTELGMKRLEHPPYSPDLAPSDFFLFGYLKKLLEGQEFENENQLFDKVTEILNAIPKTVFKSAYDEWMNRLMVCIETKGNYIH